MNRSLILTLLLLSATSANAQSPGGVSGNLRWWLKANAGVLNPSLAAAANGDAVAQWNDQSTIANNASQGTAANRPIYNTNVINGYPVLRYAGNQFVSAASAPGIAPTNSFFFFLVFKQSSFTAGGTADGAGTYILDRTTATNNLTSFKIVNTDKYFLQKRNDDGSGIGGPVSTTSATTSSFVLVDFYRNFGSAYGIFLNGKADATSGDDSGNLTGPTLRVGRHTSTANGGLNGDLAEIIVYNTNLSAANRTRIESYLAIKYGITLDQTTATDYVSSTGAVVYPATTTHDTHDNDIAGIGRDDASALVHAASKSQNAQAILSISSPSSLDDGDFLLWGHDSPTIWNSNNTPPGYANRLNRVYRAAHTGNVGTVSVSFDLSGLGIDLSDPNKFALLLDSDGNFDNATPHITGRSIVGNIVSFTLASINNNDYFTLATDLVPGPGGVAGSIVWLRADLNVYNDAGVTLASNGQTVRQWNNQGQATYNVSQATAGNRPLYVTSVFNSNPVVRFTSGGATHNFLDFGAMGIASSSDLNMVIVVRPSSVANAGAVTDGAGGYLLDRNSGSVSTNPLFDLKLVTPGNFGLQKRDDSGGGLGGPATTTAASLTAPQIVGFYRDYSVRWGIYYNGVQQATITPDINGGLTLPNLRLGAHYDGDKGFNGDVSEFIFYNADLTASQRNLINSYLAIKYGITLDQSSLTNYTASSGAIIYPTTTTHSAYKFDIAGIGKDNVSKLTQPSSRSVNTGSVVRIQNPSSLDDLDFLVWGSNNGSLVNPNIADVDGTLMKARLSRVWKVSETGQTGTVDITFDLSGVPGSKAQADLRLMIDRDGDGFADNDVAPLTGTLVGANFTVTGVDFQHNDFFTVGSTNLATTPLPVSLTEFNVVYKKPVGLLNWKTASELDNDYFTIQRSFDGEEFHDLGVVPGHGTSQEIHQYVFEDRRPQIGTSYYRIKQTDLDGAFSYSWIRPLTIDAQSLAPFLFPNPSDGQSFELFLPENSATVQIEIWNLLGSQLETSRLDRTSSENYLKVVPHEQLSPGVYIIRAVTNDIATSFKLVVR